MISRFLRKTDAINETRFIRSNHIQLLDRIKIASIAILILYPYFFFVDFFVLADIQDTIFKHTLSGIHITGLLISIVYLIIIHTLRHKESFLNSMKSTILINSMITLYIFMGALASINSQRLTGNIDAYIILMICVSVLFTVRPLHFFFILLVNHSFFLLCLAWLHKGSYSLVTKQINSTATVVFSLLIVFTFYSFRKNDFINKEKLKRSEDNFRKLFEVNPYPLTLTRLEDGKVILANQQAFDFYKMPVGQTDHVNANAMYRNQEDRLAIIKDLEKSGSIKNYVVEHKISGYEMKWVMINCELIEYEDQKCILSGATDITELKRLEDELTKHASTDMLTGVLNRRIGMELLQKELTRVKSQEGEFIICFIDIDHLKEVNDKYGHSEGDDMINAVCQVIKNRIGKEDVFFRWGGDEFIIVFCHKNLSEVNKLWNQVTREFNQIDTTVHKPYTISVSHGFFHYQARMDMTLDEIINQADSFMYKEKSNRKRNHFVEV